jgi:hypothetical protein
MPFPNQAGGLNQMVIPFNFLLLHIIFPSLFKQNYGGGGYGNAMQQLGALGNGNMNQYVSERK